MTIKPYLILLLFAVVFSSCTKDLVNEETSLEVNLLGLEIDTSESVDADEQSTVNRATTNITSAETLPVELASIPFDEQFGITFSLSRDVPSTSSQDREQASTNTVARTAGITNTGPKSWKLDNGIKYRVLAYDSNENKVVDTVYTVGAI